MVTVELETFTALPVTLMVSTVELSDNFLMVMLPSVIAWTVSEKCMTKLAVVKTAVAPSEGDKLQIVGARVSTSVVISASVVKFHVVASKIPEYGLFDASINVP